MDILQVFLVSTTLLSLSIPTFILKKLNLVSKEGQKTLSAILLYVSAPFLTITSFQKNNFSNDILANMGVIFLVAMAVHIVIFVIVKFSLVKTKMDRAEQGIYSYAMVFSNCGFMGIPFLLMLGLNEAVVYAAVFMVVFNMLSWSLGIYALSGEKKYISVKKIFFNPPTIALLIALPLFFFDIKLASISETVYKVIELLGDMTTALSMMILGIRLADMNTKEVVGDKTSYLFVIIKLFAVPLFVLAITSILPISHMLKVTLVLMSAMPSASSIIPMCNLFGGEEKVAVRIMILTTICSILSVPIVAMLL